MSSDYARIFKGIAMGLSLFSFHQVTVLPFPNGAICKVSAMQNLTCPKLQQTSSPLRTAVSRRIKFMSIWATVGSLKGDPSANTHTFGNAAIAARVASPSSLKLAVAVVILAALIVPSRKSVFSTPNSRIQSRIRMASWKMGGSDDWEGSLLKS
ncbi:hypothetical protein CH063_11660 [Colletotrichum higginsianum]|uniref:Uncharacterized protein n=1 Tax=Colletotrichum higginsianum (strain IMI 349063) TaxID=759273 RepID=H1VM97_COLHI|nr:hypothetical protein CH063_11660 [Colletotrichum higginsianum]